MITSIIEVFTLCGFIYGAACKLPPSLTIFIMNGCFCFPIGYYLIHQLRGINANTRKHGNKKYKRIRSVGSGSAATEDLPLKGKCALITSEVLGFIMQLGALVSIPVLLATEHFYFPSGKANHYITATYILIPLSLSVISILWSGWIQKLIMRASGNDMPLSNETTNSELERTSVDDDKTARLKTGSYVNKINAYSHEYFVNSYERSYYVIELAIIPLCSYLHSYESCCTL